jgi:hypothetical protein
MKKMLLLCGTLLVVSASIAPADTLNLGWGACAGDLGPNVQTYGCTSSIGNMTLALSYTPTDAVVGYVGLVGTVNVGTDGPLPSWWGNGCLGKLPTAALGSNAANTGCSNDAYGGVAGGGGVSAVRNLWNGANTTQVEFAWANAAGTEQPMLANTEYFVANVTISTAKSTVASNCPGCLIPACITFARAIIDRLGFPLPLTVTQGGAQQLVYWQAPTTGSGCYGATPASASTWGSVKALYR